MSDRDTIARRRAEFLAAFNREDMETMAEITAEDIVAMVPNRPQLSGKAALLPFWREGFAAAESRFSVTPEELEITGDVAIDRFRWSMSSAPRNGGASVDDEGKCVWIWRRESDGAWRHSRSIWNSDHAQAGVWSGAASSNSALTERDRETLHAMAEREWTGAWLARDWNRVLAMCAEDVVYMPADHPVLHGKAELRDWLAQFPPTTRFSQPVERTEGSALLATVHARFAVTIEIDGRPIENTGKVIATLQKTADRWLVKSVCWNFDRAMAAVA